eukprot:SAG22_NODE_2085_length_3032_cov_2.908285_3_plen_100_part_00
MEWEGIWASQYPSNDGKDGKVDLIRVDHRKPIRVNTGGGASVDTGATKEDKNCIVATKLTGESSCAAPPRPAPHAQAALPPGLAVACVTVLKSTACARA